ncbi:MAG: SusC/RagA family TonB-linked outer membrane protein [Gemmatimonadetes bacterium]|nr:SusC/RagA family TonB-linked outer membrane protein [Gemmatimonadota bacterium]
MMKWRWMAAMLVALVAVPAGLDGQASGTVSGTAIDAATGRPLSGVQVMIVDTPLGALTGANGRFEIRSVPAGQHTVHAILMGYRAEDHEVTVAPGATVNITISFEEAGVELEGLVVTALGIRRQERTLTTSVQQVGGDELARVPDPNIVAALSGKLAGASIFNSNTAGGSSRIVIRGANSLTGNNQPLFVVDGTPVSNSVGSGVFGSRGYAAIDYGNAIQDLNANDIESISVLKGPNAAALYGSRAANGAIIITTKKGRGSRGVTVTSTLTFESPLRLPEYQNQYGQGWNGQYSYVDGKGGGTYDDYDESWGPALDMGLMIPQFFSEGVPVLWESHPENVRNFFETGVTSVTSAALSMGSEAASARLSLGNFDQNGMLPSFRLKRRTIGVNAAGALSEKLQAQVSFQYLNVDGANRPGQGYSSDNPMFGFVWSGRQIDTGILKDRLYNPDGSQFNWNNRWNNNPYWVTGVNQNWDSRDRVIGTGSVTYQVNPWLSATLRSGTDWYQDHRKRIFAAGTLGQSGVDPNGAFGEGNGFRQETNSDFLVTANPELNGDFTVTVNAGGNRRDTEYRSNDVYVRNLVIPGLYDLGNAAVTPDMGDWREKQRVNSLYAAAQFGFRNYLFVDVTGRDDWSSTLPEDHNSYFYPSVSGSFVFSDLVDISSLTYGKLRAGWTAVGNDASAFSLVDPYVAYTPFGGVPRYSASSSLRNFDLKPERTEAWEVGGEFRFMNDRLGVDLTYYNKKTINQIVPAQISALTGFTSRFVNAGTIRNKGVEAQVTATPVRMRDGFEWEVTANYSKNNSMVEDLYGDLETIVLDSYYGVSVEARKGEPYGQMYGRLYARDGAGNIVVGSNGNPQNSSSNPVGVVGNYNPDWVGAIGNRFHYGAFDLSVLVDTRQGGTVFSMTNRYGERSGVLALSLPGREEHDANGVPIPTSEGGGLIVPGVMVVAGDTVPNTIRTAAQSYHRSLSGIAEAFAYDASFVKLREVRLGIEVPQSFTDRIGVAQMSLALIGRNLLLWADIPNIDPETALNSGNAQGFEWGQLPSQRSYGLTISITPGF